MKFGHLLTMLAVGIWLIILAHGINGKFDKLEKSLLSRTAPIQQQDPNFIEVFKEKDKQIEHLRQICLTLENRIRQNAEKFKAEQK